MSDEIDARRAPTDLDVDMPVRTSPGACRRRCGAPGVFEATPPAPDWFHRRSPRTPERSFVTSGGVARGADLGRGAASPACCWCTATAPTPTGGAPSRPYLAKDYRVTAMSLAGMGDSDWRETYRFHDFAADAEAVARATGLYDGGRKPIYIGHSFGGGQVFYTAAALSASRCTPRCWWTPASAARPPRCWPSAEARRDAGQQPQPPTGPAGSIRPWRRRWRASA